MNLIERLRNPRLRGRMSPEASEHVYAMASSMEDAADAIEALRRYACHMGDCELAFPSKDDFPKCDCGLDDLLAKLGGE